MIRSRSRGRQQLRFYCIVENKTTDISSPYGKYNYQCRGRHTLPVPSRQMVCFKAKQQTYFNLTVMYNSQINNVLHRQVCKASICLSMNHRCLSLFSLTLLFPFLIWHLKHIIFNILNLQQRSFIQIKHKMVVSMWCAF